MEKHSQQKHTTNGMQHDNMTIGFICACFYRCFQRGLIVVSHAQSYKLLSFHTLFATQNPAYNRLYLTLLYDMIVGFYCLNVGFVQFDTLSYTEKM